ncbi:MAG: DUF1538 family protein [Spirochaetes bacterium]|nr:DUF1538 family protein [Spirochaetota bacterium]
MARSKGINIPLRSAFYLVVTHFAGLIKDQVKSVAFIILYLVLFQIIVLDSPLQDAAGVATGVALVIAGLAFFLEGIMLGLMPLGERVGVKITGRGGIASALVFALLIGLGSTFAEPAIAALRTAGSAVTPWDAPLLFVLLGRHADALFTAIGIGVGAAVVLGMLRLYYGLSLKPFLFVSVSAALAISLAMLYDPNLKSVVGLAWDTGAVTTGAVTVPIVLALGIGVSRSSGNTEKAGAGFGTVALASVLPVVTVLLLAVILNSKVPSPTSEAGFYSAENRETAMMLFINSEEFYKHGLDSSDLEIRKQLRAEFEDLYNIKNLENNIRGSEFSGETMRDIFKVEAFLSVRAILPLTMLLAIALVFVRARPENTDEVILGVVLAVVGMAILSAGIRLGLAPLGDETGGQLPRTFRTEPEDIGRVVFENFDDKLLFESIDVTGERKQFFYSHYDSEPRAIEFNPKQYNSKNKRYVHIVSRPPLFGPDLTLLGIFLVFAFAFGMGWGSTLAEPSLNALGKTVENITVGTVKQKGVVYAVSLGVGLGLVVGVARIMYDVSILWLIVPPYLLLLVLTFFSDEDFTGIAWDCGGVTTGTVTVPLVLAMGLGIGNELDVIDGFGILSMASVYPILSVMIYGLVLKSRQQRTLIAKPGEENNG